MIMFGYIVTGLVFFQLGSTELGTYSFPDDFAFGVATSAYQIEGAFNEEGKSDSIWDHSVHQNPGWIIDGTNGEVVCDSYHKWQEDVQIIKNLGVDYYRFSIAWTRILPDGHKDSEVNEKGVAYYNNIIDALIAKGITPMVTMYHWDLPQILQEKGGWINETIVDDFANYAKVLFERFGDRVKHWITFNEPFQVCESGYSEDSMPPFMNIVAVGGYICAHNLILSHGRAYREYDENFRKIQKGKVSITVSTSWYEPNSDSDEDKAAAERAIQFYYGWYMHPIVKGNYPPIMIERIDAISKEEGYEESRLPKFTEEQIEMLRGTFDFIGINHYTTSLTTPSDDSERPSFYYDCSVQETTDPTWEVSSTSFWLTKVPWGFRKLLVWIKEEYGNPQVLITENGWSGTKGLNDADRISYVNEYLSKLLKAIHEDGCNVIGYTHWSLLDNLEWRFGLIPKFGLVEVDFDSTNRTRTPRDSYYVYQKIITSRKIN